MFKIKNKKSSISLLSIIILSSLLVWNLGLWTLSSFTSYIKVEAEESDEFYNKEIKEAIDRLNNKKQQIAYLQKNSIQVKERISMLEESNVELKAQFEKIAKQLKEAEDALNLRQKEYEEATEDVAKKQREYNYRLATMFYYYKKSPLEILMDSKSINGFFSNMRLIKLIADADKNSLDELNTAKEVAKKSESLADEVYKEFGKFYEEKQKELDQLEAGILNANSQLAEMNSILSTSNHDISKLENDLAQKQAAYTAFKQKQKQYKIEFTGGGAIWPLPAGHMITSPYGKRDLEFDRVNNYYHTGMDISGPSVAGTPVLAAWSGYVTNVHYPYPGQLYANDANYVQLAHGNGIGTGYWHLQTITVAEGQFVAQGTVIGTCGSTGNSYGPHLHFEVYDPSSPNKGIRDTIDPATVLMQ